jgi:hypothetical protein
VPPVVVTLLNDENLPLYEWSVAPSVPVLQSGEVVDFSTQVTAPPPGATKVRLTFASGRIQVPSPAVPQPPEQPAETASSAEPQAAEAAPAEPANQEPAHSEPAH